MAKSSSPLLPEWNRAEHIYSQETPRTSSKSKAQGKWYPVQIDWRCRYRIDKERIKVRTANNKKRTWKTLVKRWRRHLIIQVTVCSSACLRCHVWLGLQPSHPLQLFMLKIYRNSTKIEIHPEKEMCCPIWLGSSDLGPEQRASIRTRDSLRAELLAALKGNI